MIIKIFKPHKEVQVYDMGLLFVVFFVLEVFTHTPYSNTLQIGKHSFIYDFFILHFLFLFFIIFISNLYLFFLQVIALSLTAIFFLLKT